MNAYQCRYGSGCSTTSVTPPPCSRFHTGRRTAMGEEKAGTPMPHTPVCKSVKSLSTTRYPGKSQRTAAPTLGRANTACRTRPSARSVFSFQAHARRACLPPCSPALQTMTAPSRTCASRPCRVALHTALTSACNDAWSMLLSLPTPNSRWLSMRIST